MDTCYATTELKNQFCSITYLSRADKKQETRKGRKKVSNYPDKKGILAGKTTACYQWLESLQHDTEVEYHALMYDAKKLIGCILKINYKKQNNRRNKHRLDNFHREMTARDILEKAMKDNALKMRIVSKVETEKEILIPIKNNKIPIYDIYDVVRLLIALQEAITLHKIVDFLDIPDVLHVTWCIQQVGIRYYYEQMKMMINHY